MSVNRFRLHIAVLPEDDADRQIANGLFVELRTLQVDILRPAGGWLEVLDRFKCDQVTRMRKYPERLMVLLIDFDGRSERRSQATAAIPEDLRERVFVLGAWKEPEDLRRAGLGPFETIGASLARECRSGERAIWQHAMLRHNENELARLCERASSVLIA